MKVVLARLMTGKEWHSLSTLEDLLNSSAKLQISKSDREAIELRIQELRKGVGSTVVVNSGRPSLNYPYGIGHEVSGSRGTAYTVGAYTDFGISDAMEDISPEFGMYLSKYTEPTLRRVETALHGLAAALGLSDIELIDEEYGSIRRRFRGVRQITDSDFAKNRLAEVEQAISLAISGKAKAEVDSLVGATATQLIAGIADVPSAVVYIGNILIVKYQNGGRPVMLVRNLSALEDDAIRKHPGIMSDPSSTLALLAATVTAVRDEQQLNSAQDPGN